MKLWHRPCGCRQLAVAAVCCCRCRGVWLRGLMPPDRKGRTRGRAAAGMPTSKEADVGVGGSIDARISRGRVLAVGGCGRHASR